MRPISKPVAAKAFFSAWATALLVICSSLMVSHWVALPTPSTANTLIRTASTDSFVSQNVQVFHVLLKSCPCSRRIAEHLKSRQEILGVDEHIVLVGHDSDTDNYDWTFPDYFFVRVESADDVSQKLGIESAPLFVVTNGDEELVYSGGYTNRKQGPQIQDTQIITAVLRGERPEPLPVLGCAISKRLKNVIDPLGLK